MQTDTTRVGTAAAARSGVERPTQPDLVPVAIGPTAVDQPALLTPVPTLAYGLGTQPAVPAAPALPTARPRRWLAPAFIGTLLVVAAGVAWFFLDTTKPAAEIEVPAPQPAPMPVEVRIPTKPIEVPPLPPPKSDPEPGPVKPVPRTDLRRPLMAPKLPKDPVVARPRATQEQVIACLEGYIVKMKGDAMYLQLLESNRKDASDPALLNKVIDGLHAFEKAHPDLVPGHDRHPPRISCLP